MRLYISAVSYGDADETGFAFLMFGVWSGFSGLPCLFRSLGSLMRLFQESSPDVAGSGAGVAKGGCVDVLDRIGVGDVGYVCDEADPRPASVEIKGAMLMKRGAPMMVMTSSSNPCAVPPRDRTMMERMNVVSRTGRAIIHAPKPTKGTAEIPHVTNSRIQPALAGPLRACPSRLPPPPTASAFCLDRAFAGSLE